MPPGTGTQPPSPYRRAGVFPSGGSAAAQPPPPPPAGAAEATAEASAAGAAAYTRDYQVGAIDVPSMASTLQPNDLLALVSEATSGVEVVGHVVVPAGGDGLSEESPPPPPAAPAVDAEAIEASMAEMVRRQAGIGAELQESTGVESLITNALHMVQAAEQDRDSAQRKADALEGRNLVLQARLEELGAAYEVGSLDNLLESVGPVGAAAAAAVATAPAAGGAAAAAAPAKKSLQCARRDVSPSRPPPRAGGGGGGGGGAGAGAGGGNGGWQRFVEAWEGEQNKLTGTASLR
eukprot:Rhum_TRINITY_DN14409_c10_g3::Rhum_TRINITY_DN14409_c10_g3_i1::g.88378::m.88378